MYRLRSATILRLLAVLTAFSTFILSLAPALGQQAVQVSYGEWLRSQLRAPYDALLEASLADVEAERYESLNDFLAAFVDNVEAAGTDAGRFFGVEGMSGGHLVAYLESRFLHLSPDALPARTFITMAPSTTVSHDRTAAYAVDPGRTAERPLASRASAAADATGLAGSASALFPHRARAP